MINPKKSIPKYTIIRLQKTKTENLEAVREKKLIMFKGFSIRLIAKYLRQRQWEVIFEVLGGKTCQSRILCLAKLLLKIRGEIKMFWKTKAEGIC